SRRTGFTLPNAGRIASRNGSATAAPAPRRIVRREMCFLVINLISVPFPGARRKLWSLARTLHFKRQTLHNAEYKLREAIIVRRQIRFDCLQRRPVIPFEPAAQRVDHHLLRDRGGE